MHVFNVSYMFTVPLPDTEATVAKYNSYALRLLVCAISGVSRSLGPHFLPHPPFYGDDLLPHCSSLPLCLHLCCDVALKRLT